MSNQPLQRRIVAALAGHGSTVMFGLPGGGPNLDVVGAAVEVGQRFVLAHGETAAAIMASTHGLLTGTPSAVVVTRGPGAASVVNGTAQATLDRYPLVVITDTVPAAVSERVPHQRVDQRTMFAPVTKASATASDGTSDDTLGSLVAATGQWPFGAVHLDYDPTAAADDAVVDDAAVEHAAVDDAAVEHAAVDDAVVDDARADDPAPLLGDARRLLAAARRPVVIAGFEAAVDGSEIGRALVELGCPVLSTYQAVGVVATEGDTSAGLFTNGASERALLDQADLIIAVGLDVVEPIPAPWGYHAPVIAISSRTLTDPYLPIAIELIGQPAKVLEALSVGRPGLAVGDWAAADGARHRDDVRRRLRAAPAPEPSGFGPLQLVDTLARHADRFGTVTVDAGAHFLAIMPLWPVAEPLRLLISNGLATMGFALPAAIGAAIARQGEPVLALTGDGGLAMALAELETVARLDLPITVVVFNDAALSLIEIKQKSGHGGREAVHYNPIDFTAVANGLGLDALVVTNVDELEAAFVDHVAGPRLIDARIDPSQYPHLISVTRG